MKRFLDLVVHGNPDALGKLMAAIESRLEPNWHRDLETEKRAAHIKYPRLYFICCRKPSGDIGFALAEYEGAICVDNVFLYPDRNLAAPEYSELLEDFFRRFVKPAADQLGLKYFSTGFADRPPTWAKRRHYSATEIALGWRVARQLLREGYIRHFPVRDETTGVPIDRHSTARRLIEMSPWCQN
jgi:hypothetical protein